MSELRSFLTQISRINELKEVNEELSIKYEIPKFIKDSGETHALMFKNVKGFKNKIVASLCATRKRIALAINSSESKLNEDILKAMNNPTIPSYVRECPAKEIEEKPKLSKLPILTHYEKDPAPYITSAVITAKAPNEKIENVSIHRLMLLDDNHLGIRIVPRHLYRICQIAKDKGEKSVDISIAIGVHPAILVAAASPLPFGVSEYFMANSLMNGKLELTKCESVEANAPAKSEIILEGKILLEKEVMEGPFVDLTGTYDSVRKQPIIEITKIFHRKDFIYHVILPGGKEHKLLMGLPFEAKIFEAVCSVVPKVNAVVLTSGGCGWLHAIVSIEKQTEGDGKNAILAAFSAHPSLKHVIVVDSDIDINNLEDVEWAIATRFQADKDLIVISDVRGSSLDPSADQENALTAKMGIDATRSLFKPKEKFMKAKIPGG
ncbi:MAG: UbiD family decarboxylase [Candidatus Bathyarchaeia archaeon]